MPVANNPKPDVQPPGPAADAQGRSAIDPSLNVIALNDASTRRLDDLRQAESRFLDAKIQHLEETAQLRADYNTLLREAESKRIDAIRAVDVAAVQRAAEVSATQAQTLACVAADTPILCADLVWRPAGDLQVGDELIAFSEDVAPLHLNAIMSRGRTLQRATVTANSIQDDELLQVTTPLGVVRCNRQHPWLTRKPYSKEAKWVWVPASDLRPGDHVLRPFDPWEVDRSYEAGWLAGIIDGEGCLSMGNLANKNYKLTVVQVDGPIADDIIREMLARCPRTHVHHQLPPFPRQPRNNITVSNLADVLKILGSVRPRRLLRDADEVWEGKYLSAPQTSVVVQAIDHIGVGAIASLSTDTHTYIANGFAMHNTSVATSAEALRAQVAITQTAAAAALSAALDPIQKSIDDLRRAQYEAQGVKAQAVDQRGSNGMMISMIAVGVSVLILLIGIGGFLIAKPV